MSAGPSEPGAPAGARDGLVAFLFGVAGVPELPGMVLTELLGEFGMSVAAARRQVARMREEGKLASSRTGRGASYRLAGPFGATWARLRGSRDGPSAAPGDLRRDATWDGAFHGLLYQVPEVDRAYRNRLRRRAAAVGYGVLQPGVLIATEDRSGEVADVLAARPAAAHLHHVRIAMGVDEAAEVVARAWELSGIADALTGRLGELDRALADPAEPAVSAATLRRMAELVGSASATLVGVPVLPFQLCPPDWPGEQVRVALEHVKDRYLPSATRYVHTLLDAAD